MDVMKSRQAEMAFYAQAAERARRELAGMPSTWWLHKQQRTRRKWLKYVLSDYQKILRDPIGTVDEQHNFNKGLAVLREEGVDLAPGAHIYVPGAINPPEAETERARATPPPPTPTQIARARSITGFAADLDSDAVDALPVTGMIYPPVPRPGDSVPDFSDDFGESLVEDSSPVDTPPPPTPDPPADPWENTFDSRKTRVPPGADGDKRARRRERREKARGRRKTRPPIPGTSLDLADPGVLPDDMKLEPPEVTVYRERNKPNPPPIRPSEPAPQPGWLEGLLRNLFSGRHPGGASSSGVGGGPPPLPPDGGGGGGGSGDGGGMPNFGGRRFVGLGRGKLATGLRASAGDPTAAVQLAEEEVRARVAALGQAGADAKGVVTSDRIGGVGGHALGVSKNLSRAFGMNWDPTRLFLGLGEAVFKSTDAFRDFNEAMTKANFQFAEFSGAMARVEAQQEVRSIFLSKERGDRRAYSADTLARAKHRLEKSMAPWEDTWASMKGELFGFLANRFADVVEKLNALLGYLSGRNEYDMADQLTQLAKEGEDDLWGKYGKPGRFRAPD